MSLRKNFLYSSILTVSNYLFPLLVYPYVSRVLGLSNIGIVNFVDNIINYFVCIAMMGISTVGVREIAAAREGKAQLSKTFMSLLTLTAISTLAAIAVLWIAMYTLPTLAPHRDILYVGMVKLAFNLLLIEWFFTGMENFRYITNRTILVKTLYVICVFLFVRQASDYQLFYTLSVAMVVVNGLINVLYSRKFVSYTLSGLDMRPFRKAFILMGVYVLIINVYTSVNTVWLGFVTNTDEVGYFTTATKLHTIIMAILSSFTNILFPRLSHLLAEGKDQEFWEKITVALNIVFAFAFPAIIFMLVAGPQLLLLIVGSGFEGAYLPMRVITPLILIIGIEQILVIQILLAKHQDDAVLRNCICGALVSVVCNLLLTSHLGAVGSAIVWVVAEGTIMCLSMVDVYRKYNFVMPYKRLLLYGATYTPLIVGTIILHQTIANHYVMLVSVGVLTAAYAAVTELYILKNQLARDLLQNVLAHLKH